MGRCPERDLYNMRARTTVSRDSAAAVTTVVPRGCNKKHRRGNRDEAGRQDPTEKHEARKENACGVSGERTTRGKGSSCKERPKLKAGPRMKQMSTDRLTFTSRKALLNQGPPISYAVGSAFLIPFLATQNGTVISPAKLSPFAFRERLRRPGTRHAPGHKTQPLGFMQRR